MKDSSLAPQILQDWIHVQEKSYAKAELILAFYGGIGDEVMLTAIAEHAVNAGLSVWLVVKNVALFFGINSKKLVVLQRESWMDEQGIETVSMPRLCYSHATDFPRDRWEVPSQHIIALLAHACGLQGNLALLPRLAPQRMYSEFREHVVLQSTGLGARFSMRNKEWGISNMCALTERIAKEVPTLQLGLPSDPPLPVALDLRGKTTLAEARDVLSSARLFVGLAGNLMHIARSVDCPAIIIYGGREHPTQSGYSCNFNLFSALPCSPCWRWNTCDYDHRCMREISVDAVVAAVKTALSRPRGDLMVDRIEL